jgi:RHS repeat-associated protein
MTTGDKTRLFKVTTSGVSTDQYDYDTEGRIGTRTLTMTTRPGYPLVTDYIYDALDRVTDVRYPAQYGVAGNSRKVVHQDYDVSSRLTGLTVDGASYASNIVYNAASQTTSLNVGAADANQIAESYTYGDTTGLLTNQKVQRSGVSLMDLSYDYLRPGTTSGRTGQLAKITDNLNRNHDRRYGYDALGRLTTVKGGQFGNWSQRYDYDRYGNRIGVKAGRAAFDYDADGKTDLSVWRPSDGYWNIINSSTGGGAFQAWGNPNSTDKPVPGDYDGDGKTDFAIWREGVWWIINSSNGSQTTQTCGLSGDIPVPGDYDGDGKTDLAVWRPSEGYWYIVNSSTGGVTIRPWGNPNSTDKPVPGDYDGDGKTDLAIWREGVWWIINSSNGSQTTQTWGLSGDAPTPSMVSIANNGGSLLVPRDGLASVSYDSATNRINTAGWEYDAAGNQTRVQRADGSWQRYVYDAARRLAQVKDDAGNILIVNTYGASNHRLVEQIGTSNQRTYYAWAGDSVIVEYSESDTNPSAPVWSKSYVYLGARLLATIAPSGGIERVEYQHPDRLGTRLVTNNQDTSYTEQVTLPFGTALDAESSGATKRRFTSYDRSNMSGLDYAVNRHYDPLQGRFTQVDPIGMRSTSLSNPQTLNLYAYCANDPINRADPSGLGFFSFLGKIFGFFAKIAKWVAIVVAVAVIVAAALQFGFGVQLLPILGDVLSKLGILQLATPGALSFSAGGAMGVGLGTTGYVIAGLGAAGAVNSFLQKKGEQLPTNTSELKMMLKAFYSKYQKILARCIWKVFSVDKYGIPSTIAQTMQRQTFRNAPVSSIVLGRRQSELGAQGVFEGSTGSIYIASDLHPMTLDNGRQVPLQEKFFRLYAHELGNRLSWLHTGMGGTFGTLDGIPGQQVLGPGLHSVNVDNDTGARLEKCMWGDVAY